MHQTSERSVVVDRLVTALAVWAAAYAAYRAYYAFGGEYGMIGKPRSASDFRALNGAGAAIILVAAILPVVFVRVDTLRRALPVLGWIAAVGCCGHALVDICLRVLSLTGVHPTELPRSVWRSYDRQQSDLQDLLFNEPWFMVEGLLWAALALQFVRPSQRRRWIVSALAATAVWTLIGVLSGIDAIGSFRVG